MDVVINRVSSSNRNGVEFTVANWNLVFHLTSRKPINLILNFYAKSC